MDISNLTFKYGFNYSGKSYRWKDGYLLRLPYSNGSRCYDAIWLTPAIRRNKMGYYIDGNFLSYDRLKHITRPLAASAHHPASQEAYLPVVLHPAD